MSNTLYYGDNLEVMRKYIKDETVDLCYIDPPFNSKRNYNQIYNNIGTDDRAQAQAFVDTWTWDTNAIEGFTEILANDKCRFTPQTVDLIKGLETVLKKGSLLAYLVSMALRITEIHRALKTTGSFYLHCDPTASHYLKLVCDTIFVTSGGDFQNEIIWHYRRYTGVSDHFQRLHDVVLLYSKSQNPFFRVLREDYAEGSGKKDSHYKQDIDGRWFRIQKRKGKEPYKIYLSSAGVRVGDVWLMQHINASASERMGYPTQKPEALLERIIEASTQVGGIVLDAYCGCGTSVAVAERLKRSWIGIDITYQSVSLILRRLEQQFGKAVVDSISINGIPQDMASAHALALKKDDRVRKEFEKWAVLTYSNNRAIINDKKGGDGGVDGTAYFLIGRDENAKIVFQVKSGNVGRGEIAKLNSDRQREGAELAVFITLQEPTKGMNVEAKGVGLYAHSTMGRSYPRVQIVTIAEIVEQHKRLDIPMSLEVLRKAKATVAADQLNMLDHSDMATPPLQVKLERPVEIDTPEIFRPRKTGK